jgi:hypothetical protein
MKIYADRLAACRTFSEENDMLTVEGTYKNGHIELAEVPVEVTEARVLITFLEPKYVDLQARGIDEQQAADLRARFNTIAEDWDRPEMDIYDED